MPCIGASNKSSETQGKTVESGETRRDGLLCRHQIISSLFQAFKWWSQCGALSI